MIRTTLLLALWLIGVGCASLLDSDSSPPRGPRSKHFEITGTVVDSSGATLTGVNILLEKMRLRQTDGVGDYGFRYSDTTHASLTCDGPFSILEMDLSSLRLTFSKDGYEPASLYYTFTETYGKRYWWVVHHDVKVILKKQSSE